MRKGVLAQLRWGCSVVALIFAVGCTGEESSHEDFAVQRQSCDELFGAKAMSSVRKMMDDRDIRFTNTARKLDELKSDMVKEVHRWDSSQTRYQLSEYDVCSFRGKAQNFSSSVEWSVSSMEEVRSTSSRWYAGGGDVFLADKGLMGGDIGLIFPCRINGAAAGQQEQIPLQVRVGKMGSPGFSDNFHQDLVIRLAKSMREELGCVNRPKIPDSLTRTR